MRAAGLIVCFAVLVYEVARWALCTPRRWCTVQVRADVRASPVL